MDTGTHSRTNVSQKLEKMEVSPWKESCLGIYKMRDRERPDDRNLTPIKVGIYKMRERDPMTEISLQLKWYILLD